MAIVSATSTATLTASIAALADARAAGCGRVLCLGDLVDGGKENERVVRYVRDHDIPTVRGNHDENNALDLADDVRAYLEALPEELREGDVLYTHISPRPKKAKIIDEYEAWNAFDETDARLVFVGHAHIPMLYGERCAHACQATDYPVVPNTPFALDPEGPLHRLRRGHRVRARRHSQTALRDL